MDEKRQMLSEPGPSVRAQCNSRITDRIKKESEKEREIKSQRKDPTKCDTLNCGLIKWVRCHTLQNGNHVIAACEITSTTSCTGHVHW